MPFKVSAIIARLAGIALSLTIAGAASANDIQLTPDEMREDLRFLKEEWAAQDNSFSASQREEFNRHVDATAAKADDLAPQAFALEVMRAAAIARNGHTNANVSEFLGDDLPVRLWSFSDGLYVVKAHPEHERLLGARVERIGALTTEEAQARLRPYLAGTDQRARFLAPGFLVAPAVLRHIGAVEETTVVPLALRLADGRTETVELAATKDADPGDERSAKLNRGYTVMLPDGRDLPGRWSHVLDDRADLPPSYVARTDVQSRFLDASDKVLYVRIDSSRSTDETPLYDKLAGIVVTNILPKQPKHVVVDLRLNNGGDFFNTILFSRAIPRLVPRDGHVFVLVGRATFSAGITTAAMLEGEDRDKVTLVGETMGDSGQFWSEGQFVDLPNSKIAVRYSPQFHDYETGCFDIADCYWATVAFGPRDISIEPEVTVEPSFGDYAGGRDPVLEKVQEMIARP